MAVVERFVGVDVHQHNVMVAAIDTVQQVVLAPRKMSLERFALWAPEQLTSGGLGSDGQRLDAV
jgi:hypothetical protein